MSLNLKIKESCKATNYSKCHLWKKATKTIPKQGAGQDVFWSEINGDRENPGPSKYRML
jgi:hypothetical protein